MSTGNEKISLFEMAKKHVDMAAKYLNVDPGVIEILKNTKRELIVHFPVRRRLFPDAREWL